MLAIFIYGFIIFAIVLVIIFMVEVNTKNSNKKVTIDSDALGLIHIGGIPFLDEGEKSFLEVKGDRLFINQTYYIMYERVKSVECLSETELREIAGNERKEVNGSHYFLVIDYVGKDGEELTGVFHIGDTVDMKVKKFVSEVNDKIGFIEEKEQDLSS